MDEGASTAFDAAARDQLPWLYALARRHLGDQADDVVQECLVKAHRGFDRLRDPAAAPAWFRQILLNCIRDHRRRAAGLPTLEPLHEQHGAVQATPARDPSRWTYLDRLAPELLAQLEEEEVWRVLERVSPRHRVPLVLVHMEGMTTAHVAWLFGVAQGTVLSWLHRGRKEYEHELQRYARDSAHLAHLIEAEPQVLQA